LIASVVGIDPLIIFPRGFLSHSHFARVGHPARNSPSSSFASLCLPDSALITVPSSGFFRPRLVDRPAICPRTSCVDTIAFHVIVRKTIQQ
jgi:hypothetical protein